MLQHVQEMSIYRVCLFKTIIEHCKQCMERTDYTFFTTAFCVTMFQTELLQASVNNSPSNLQEKLGDGKQQHTKPTKTTKQKQTDRKMRQSQITVFTDSSSRHHGFVCSLLFWYFLIIVTYYFYM